MRTLSLIISCVLLISCSDSNPANTDLHQELKATYELDLKNYNTLHAEYMSLVEDHEKDVAEHTLLVKGEDDPIHTVIEARHGAMKLRHNLIMQQHDSIVGVQKQLETKHAAGNTQMEALEREHKEMAETFRKLDLDFRRIKEDYRLIDSEHKEMEAAHKKDINE